MSNQTFVELFVNYFYQNADVRVRDKFLMNSPVYIIFLTIFYVITTNELLEKVKNNPKFVINTKICLIFFYIYAAISSGYILKKLVKYMIWSNYNFRCMPVDMSTKPEVLEVWKKLKHQKIVVKKLKLFLRSSMSCIWRFYWKFPSISRRSFSLLADNWNSWPRTSSPITQHIQ